MEALGLEVQTVEIDTDASVETNARVIRDTIMRIAETEGKQVILNGHSKGGVDVSAALALYPELEGHVRAVVAMQTPYGGTPIASDIAANPRLIDITATVIRRLLKGDPKALTESELRGPTSVRRGAPVPDADPHRQPGDLGRADGVRHRRDRDVRGAPLRPGERRAGADRWRSFQPDRNFVVIRATPQPKGPGPADEHVDQSRF